MYFHRNSHVEILQDFTLNLTFTPRSGLILGDKKMKMEYIRDCDRPYVRRFLPWLKASCRDCAVGSDSFRLPTGCTQAWDWGHCVWAVQRGYSVWLFSRQKQMTQFLFRSVQTRWRLHLDKNRKNNSKCVKLNFPCAAWYFLKEPEILWDTTFTV